MPICICGADIPTIMMPLHVEDHIQAGHKPEDFKENK